MERIRQPDRDHTDSLTHSIADLSYGYDSANTDLHTHHAYRNGCHHHASANHHCDTALTDSFSDCSGRDCHLGCHSCGDSYASIECIDHYTEYRTCKYNG